MQELSIVVPVYNEGLNVKALHQEIVDVCRAADYRYEIIFVDDGSTDNTLDVLKTLAPVKVVVMRKNFGQTAAMDAGIRRAKYDYIVTMDGDLQNDPADIPGMFRYLVENDLDVVAGWREQRKDRMGKRFVSRGANLLRKILLKDGIHDSGCSLKLYKKACFDHVNLYGEMHRFIPALLEIKGYRVGEVKVKHRPRVAGQTKYDWKRTIKGFVDIIAVWFWNKYAVRPLHLLGGGGLLTILCGLVVSVYTCFLFIIGQDLSNTVFPLLSIFLITTGIQLFIFGLLADIILKVYFERTNDVAYSIREYFESKR
ncbi:MAG: glycosyltransferase [Deltaproteobacteria bacterium]|nr:MAG: glycosyltransferase [Deltaproteobacteria bacterium]RUA03410.1 MAG: glycosyltransferase [Deltaproteobacteria bacterium]